ncbi:MAG: ribosome small subunit-dependent GTPase A [Tissierellales bacterium]|jgi:ribosome biogenesis GTPase|nr:ribosome small subunit-dependent GTPase A [Tissierellales bacterium]
MIDLKTYGYKDILPENKTIARITAVFRERYEIISTNGISHARLKASTYYHGNDQISFPTVGDFVEINHVEHGDSIIVDTLERKTFFSRPDPSTNHKTIQMVAANFDYVFIVMSLNKDFNLRRLERYLTLSWESGAQPIVILTKADLVDDFSEMLYDAKNIAIGANVFAVSSITGLGMDELKNSLSAEDTIVFMGSSGVGKSSLVNALANDNIMKVSSIREDDSKGRHTTTHRQLSKLDNGILVIDTPGMRELGMGEISSGLTNSFGEIESLFAECKFRNCSHKTEPGCAVQEALSNGQLSEERWQSYIKLKKEERYLESKAAKKNRKRRK